jgi:uncharacterized protein (DUF427 family)
MATPVLEEEDIQSISRPRGDELRLEPSPRWVRVLFNKVTVADSKQVLLLLEPKRLPVYYFPLSAVRMDLLEPTGRTSRSPTRGTARYYTVHVGDRLAPEAAWIHTQPARGAEQLADLVAFRWDLMDAWFEEDDEVFVHPRDPYHRVDVVHSSRHVKVIAAGEVVAETHRARLLFETGLPTRYCIPKVDVRMDLLEPTDTQTACPYKGTAVYWSLMRDGHLAQARHALVGIRWRTLHKLTNARRLVGAVR